MVTPRDTRQKILACWLDGDRECVIKADPFLQASDFVNTTLTPVQTQLAAMREAHSRLEGWILQQHQAQLTAIKSSTYTNCRQGGF